MDTDIIVALIGFAATIYAPTVGYLLHTLRKMKRDHADKLVEVANNASRLAAEKERQLFHDQVMSPFYPIKEWTSFVAKVRQIHEDTEVDRVLVLVAVNGDHTPTHASAVWDFRTYGEDYPYVDIPLDEDYVYRLLQTERIGKIRFKADDTQNSKIATFYRDEGVTEAVWALIGKRHCLNTGQVAYKYISVATHTPNGFSDPKEIERLVDSLVAEFRPMLHVSGFGPV